MKLSKPCPECGGTLVTWGVGVGCAGCSSYWAPDRLDALGFPQGPPGVLSDVRPPHPRGEYRHVRIAVSSADPEGSEQTLESLDLVGQCVALGATLDTARRLAQLLAAGSDFGPYSLGAMMRDLDAALEPVLGLLQRTLDAAGIQSDTLVTWSPPSGARPWL